MTLLVLLQRAVLNYVQASVHFNEPARGAHFAAMEQPALFVDEARATFRAGQRA